jgi:hypothetical protein
VRFGRVVTLSEEKELCILRRVCKIHRSFAAKDATQDDKNVGISFWASLLFGQLVSGKEKA